MRQSRFINIDKNVLLEYIYDDDNLISEAYNILYNTKTNIPSFTSYYDSEMNNDLSSNAYNIDPINDRWGPIILDSSVPDKIDDSLGSLQVRNFPSSVPIRYDSIKVHIPIDWTFGDYKGFYIRVYTYDFNNDKEVEFSNYYFDISSVDQSYQMGFSSPILMINENQWGKFLRIDFPSPTKVSDQRVNNVTKDNTINYNFNSGLGVSKNAPVFIDFHFIEKIDTINDKKFFILTPRVTTSVPQTPDFENIGIVIEPSSQGDYFIIYGMYNNSLAELNIFLNESYYLGNRYYIEYTIDLFEKNIKTKSQTYVITENFNQPIEYRPIIKFSTTTAVIDVTMKLIDNTSGSVISRRSSWGINVENISKYSRNLSKLNLRKATKTEVFNIKDILQPTTSNDPFGTKPILILEKLPFNLYSNDYYAYTGPDNVVFEKKNWIGLNKIVISLYPFDNILKFSILEKGGFLGYQIYDLNKVTNIKLVIKSDDKILEFDVYKDSDENEFELGKVVFKIPKTKYNDLRKINSIGYNIFYITGLNENEDRDIIYSGLFIPYDSDVNVRKLESDFAISQLPAQPNPLTEKTFDERKIESISQTSKDKLKPRGIGNKIPLLVDSKNRQKFIDKVIPSTVFRKYEDSPINIPNDWPSQYNDPQISITSGKIWVLKKKAMAILKGEPIYSGSRNITEYDLAPGEPVRNGSLLKLDPITGQPIRKDTIMMIPDENGRHRIVDSAVLYDHYVGKNGEIINDKPNRDNISNYKVASGDDEPSAVSDFKERYPNLNNVNYWKKSEWPNFAVNIYDRYEVKSVGVYYYPQRDPSMACRGLPLEIPFSDLLPVELRTPWFPYIRPVDRCARFVELFPHIVPKKDWVLRENSSNSFNKIKAGNPTNLSPPDQVDDRDRVYYIEEINI
jgi:hypothetical protein